MTATMAPEVLPETLRMGEAADALALSIETMRARVAEGGVTIDGHWFRLRSVKVGVESKVRRDDVAAARAAIGNALQGEGR